MALGACVIEKHITLDRGLPGPDHRASLEPHDLRSMVEGIRTVEQALGHGAKEPAPSEEDNRRIVRRSIAAAVDIPEGSVMLKEMLTLLRPASGIPPASLDIIVGRRVRRSLIAGELISWDNLA